jgi:hypothetical protein
MPYFINIVNLYFYLALYFRVMLNREQMLKCATSAKPRQAPAKFNKETQPTQQK